MVDTNIILTCSATYPYSFFIDVDTNVNIQWLNSSNHTLHSYTGLNDYTEHTLNYTISNVKLSDAGQYTCQYNVSSNSSFLNTSDVMIATINVSIESKSLLLCNIIRQYSIVPNNATPGIILIQHQYLYDIGSDITLSCSIKHPKSSLIDLNTSLTLQFFNSSNDFLCASTSSGTEHTLNYTINNAKLSDAGQYTCVFFIDTSTPHYYIISSNHTSSSTVIIIKSKSYLIMSTIIHVYSTKCHYSICICSTLQDLL